MSIFDFIFKKSSSEKPKQARLTSHMHAAELICACWNNLDSSIIEPYLCDCIVWKGNSHSGPLNDSVWEIGAPIIIKGKQNYLAYLDKSFATLKLMKNSFSADIVCEMNIVRE